MKWKKDLSTAPKKRSEKQAHLRNTWSLLKTKRYTWTRLQRMNTHILTKTKKADVKRMLNETHPAYIRLLGMTKKGQAYLAEKKKA